MYDTNTPAEWAAMASAATSAYAACSIPYFLLVDAELRDFDPRPLVRRALVTDTGARLVVAVFNAKTNVREAVADTRLLVFLSLRDAAISLAALLMLLTAPEATR